MSLTWDAMYRGEMLSPAEYDAHIMMLKRIDRGETLDIMSFTEREYVAYVAIMQSQLATGHPRGAWHGPPKLTSFGRRYLAERADLPALSRE